MNTSSGRLNAVVTGRCRRFKKRYAVVLGQHLARLQRDLPLPGQILLLLDRCQVQVKTRFNIKTIKSVLVSVLTIKINLKIKDLSLLCASDTL